MRNPDQLPNPPDALASGMPPPDAPLTTVCALADAVRATLRLARGLLASGRQIDLAGLHDMIGLLCARSLDLAPEHGRAMRPRLIDLLAELDALGAALTEAPPN